MIIRRIVFILCLLLLLLNGCAKEQMKVEMGSIESVEIIYGATGEKLYIDNQEILDQLEDLLHNAELNPVDEEDISGYKQLITIKGTNKLVIYSSDRVIYNGRKYSLIDSMIYLKIEDLLGL